MSKKKRYIVQEMYKLLYYLIHSSFMQNCEEYQINRKALNESNIPFIT